MVLVGGVSVDLRGLIRQESGLFCAGLGDVYSEETNLATRGALTKL